jgi:hypothetical protein
MTWTWVFFFFVAFGSKVVLAAATIYLLLPRERRCDECDGETIPIRMGLTARSFSRVFAGKVQRRWCPQCGWEGLTRTGRLNPPGTLVSDVDTEPVEQR